MMKTAEEIPCFLYEDNTGIKIGFREDSNVTDEWIDWKNKFASQFKPKWIETKGQELPINKSCLCLRNGARVCNLYFDGVDWKDDGFDSKGERVFTDVTHYILVESITLPERP